MVKRTLKSCTVLSFLMLSTVMMLYAQHPPFWNEIQTFRKQDSISAPPKKAILFVGSSSFRLWNDIQNDFPNHVIINRGFGGSTLSDVIQYANDIIFPYHPRQIVIYCGENDLASSDSIDAQAVFARFKELYSMIQKHSRKTNVVFVSIKPSPSRQRIQQNVIDANRTIEAFLMTQKRTAFVNVYDLMIDADGQPFKELFREDMLHMKPEGYVIWKKAIEPHLLK